MTAPAVRSGPPWCHKCGMLFGQPERQVETASLFVCFDPDCGGWLVLHDPDHPEHLDKLMSDVAIEDPEAIDAGDDDETLKRFCHRYARGR